MGDIMIMIALLGLVLTSIGFGFKLAREIFTKRK